MIMWRRSFCALRGGCVGEDRGARPKFNTLGDEGARELARILTRVGVCAGEFRLMKVVREEALARMSCAGGGWGSAVRNVSNARVPPSMERM